jgi:outer membrane protein assembly factor BamB
VQLGKTLFVSLLANDRVTAYDTDTGAEKWRYYAGGALRRPPAAAALPGGTNVVIFGCDDGWVYCLNAADGSERWTFRAAPNAKRAMGFGRLSSVWPVWASPVIHNGKVYFFAGLTASWGLYGYCLDAATGAVMWRSDGKTFESGCNSAMGPLALSTEQLGNHYTIA